MVQEESGKCRKRLGKVPGFVAVYNKMLKGFGEFSIREHENLSDQIKKHVILIKTKQKVTTGIRDLHN